MCHLLEVELYITLTCGEVEELNASCEVLKLKNVNAEVVETKHNKQQR